MENVAGEQGCALQRRFLYKFGFCLKISCHKISFFNDEVLKSGHFYIFDTLFQFLTFVTL